jgi:hypothetical protein
MLIAAGIFLVWVAGPLPSGQAFKRVAFPASAGVVLIVSYVPYVILRAGQVAFRADQAGITFPAMPFSSWIVWGPSGESEREFIRWSHVKGITLYTKRGKGLGRFYKTPLIEIWHPRDAHHTLSSRSITTWRLDRDRLAAIAAVAAPGIAITERERA